ncbi:MAG TPA: hypothetical protein ENK96_09585 [Desulfobulbaceae bacterium]|nr:hypothetical protein [Desulfobulbaceae bacterium]
MSEIIKIRLLNPEKKSLSPLLPVSYPVGRPLNSFVSSICNIGQSTMTFFANYADHPIDVLYSHDFDSKPLYRFFHVLCIINNPVFGTKTELLDYLETEVSLFSEKEIEKIKDFIVVALPQDEEIFETAFHGIRVLPKSIPEEYQVPVGINIISSKPENKNRFVLTCHDQYSFIKIHFELTEKGDLDLQGLVKLDLLKDIAAMDLPYEITKIGRAEVTRKGIHFEHLLKDGKRELKTFVKISSAVTLQSEAGKLKFRDTGNRILPMNIMERFPDIFTCLQIEKPYISSNFANSRKVLEHINGEVCDIFHKGRNNLYILSWEPEENKGWIFYYRLGTELPSKKRAICFTCMAKPVSFVWIDKMDLFIILLTTGTYLLSPEHDFSELIDISRLFWDNNREGEAAGDLKKISVLMFRQQALEIPFLVAARSHTIGFYLLVDVY